MNKLYITNIDKKVPKHILHELLIQTGVILSLNYPYDKIKKEYYGHCNVKYQTKEDADYTYKVLNLVELNNKPLKFFKADNSKGIKLHVKNIKEMDEKMLYDIFEKYGECVCRIIKDESGSYKHYAFVTFFKVEECEEAIKNVNKMNFNGIRMEVTYAEKQKKNQKKLLIVQH